MKKISGRKKKESYQALARMALQVEASIHELAVRDHKYAWNAAANMWNLCHALAQEIRHDNHIHECERRAEFCFRAAQRCDIKLSDRYIKETAGV